MSEDTAETYEEICTFCDEVAGRWNDFDRLEVVPDGGTYVLIETERFVVVPCVGALADWYVLVVPRRHVLSAGWLDQSERHELRALIDDLRSRLHQRTGLDTVAFEHGSLSFRDKGGACHDHAHIHVLATERPAADFLAYVRGTVSLAPCPDWIASASDMVQEAACSYLAIETTDGSLIGKATGAPSGFFRKSLLRWLGADTAEHDWLVYPHAERLQAMIETRL